MLLCRDTKYPDIVKFNHCCKEIVKEIINLGSDHLRLLEGERNEKIDAILDKYKE